MGIISVEALEKSRTITIQGQLSIPGLNIVLFAGSRGMLR
jgi:hypothetical protein